jgi:hypothetical protein
MGKDMEDPKAFCVSTIYSRKQKTYPEGMSAMDTFTSPTTAITTWRVSVPNQTVPMRSVQAVLMGFCPDCEGRSNEYGFNQLRAILLCSGKS